MSERERRRREREELRRAAESIPSLRPAIRAHIAATRRVTAALIAYRREAVAEGVGPSSENQGGAGSVPESETT